MNTFSIINFNNFGCLIECYWFTQTWTGCHSAVIITLFSTTCLSYDISQCKCQTAWILSWTKQYQPESAIPQAAQSCSISWWQSLKFSSSWHYALIHVYLQNGHLALFHQSLLTITLTGNSTSPIPACTHISMHASMHGQVN